MKLSDTHLVILSAASQRPDHGIVLPETLKGGAAQKVVTKLITEGLIEEVKAKGTLGPRPSRGMEAGAAFRKGSDDRIHRGSGGRSALLRSPNPAFRLPRARHQVGHPRWQDHPRHDSRKTEARHSGHLGSSAASRYQNAVRH